MVSCKPGFESCDGDDGDGCEASLADPETCGSCDNACGPDFSCDNGDCRCDEDADCTATGEQCCDGTCVFTHSDCFPWPCVPGTVSDAPQHCGGCGLDCPNLGYPRCCAVP